MFKNLWSWMKRIWESEKGQLINKLCNLLDLVTPWAANLVYDKAQGKLSVDTAKGIAEDVIAEVKVIIKRQL